MMDEELRERLRGAALEHRPDRERMWARVERGMARDTPPPRAARPPRAPMPRLRIAAATVAVCGVLVAVSLGVAMTGRGGGTGDPVAASPSRTPTVPALSGERGSRLPASNGPVSTDGVVDPGGNAFWAQSQVLVTAARPLSALTVELRIARTDGVSQTGSWTSGHTEDYAVAVREEGGFLVFRWTLLPGRTVPAATLTFAGQYNHAEGERDVSGDDFTVRSAFEGGVSASGGDFSSAG
ncbi:hypothetical protein [Streptomyces sp. AM 2-1-1]|uniref:hypothetical protein n=1 Tax=Streptomyces sp. AM 2-1-1 TaxID=3028709 RepID=UPI0023B8CF9F|nr:hypothetical protein [Streptomyces sp. AM 2-1-1]WEH42449.1 hypothetical protein PZB77_24765 [Streptomyces sp. AM 2-1-1]